MYVYQFKAFIHEILQYCMHSRTHPCACVHKQTLTSRGLKKPGTCLVQQFSYNLTVYWYHHSQYWLCTKYLKLLNIPAYCRAPMYVYNICMPCCHLTTLTIIHLIHHPKGWAVLYIRTYVCHI